MSKLISFVVPLQNEERNIALIYQALITQMQKLAGRFDYEIIFVDDGSTDNSLLELKKIINFDQKVKYLELSRNFGKEVALTAGLQHASGQAAITIDADLQHPPELIPEFIEQWEKGADLVIGVRKKRKIKGFFKEVGAILFYNLMNLIGEEKFVSRETDYRLINHKVLVEFNRFTERNRVTRGLFDWLGFNRVYIYFEPHKRINGKSSYTTLKLTKLALSTFVAHSLFPLKFAGYLGIGIVLFSGPLGLYIFIDKYIANDPFSFSFSGTAILAVLNLFLIGIVLSCLGLMALYIANIQNEVMNRPMYIVREKKNFNQNDGSR